MAASLPSIALQIMVLTPLLDYMNSYVSNQVQVAYTSPLPFDANTISLGIILVILSGLAQLFVGGFAIVTSSTMMKGGELDSMALLRDAYGRFWSYLKATILFVLGISAIFVVPLVFMIIFGYEGILFGGLLLIVGIFAIFYLTIRLTLYSQAVYLEDVGTVESLGRSFDLLQDRIRTTFTLLIVVWIISMIPSVVAGQVTGYIGGQLWYVGALISLVATALAAPIQPIAFTVWYYSIKARVEGSTQPPTVILGTGNPPTAG